MTVTPETIAELRRLHGQAKLYLHAVQDFHLAAYVHMPALLDEIEKLRDDRATLLVAIENAIEESRDAFGIGDWPPDTVLGEGGAQALASLEGARNGLQCTLALPQFNDHEAVVRAERAKGRARREELRAKWAAKRAAEEPKS